MALLSTGEEGKEKSVTNPKGARLDLPHTVVREGHSLVPASPKPPGKAAEEPKFPSCLCSHQHLPQRPFKCC